MKPRSWFVVGEEKGDRTLDEQLLGLEQALRECAGKSVLDIGCAEGLISLEFAKAGASKVHGIEVVPEHLEVAKGLAEKERLPVTFRQGDLYKLRPGARYYIVLALGVVHKLTDPAVGVRFAFASCKNLMVLRTSAGTYNHVLKSKRYGGSADLRAEAKRAGFRIENIAEGPRDEKVYYFRKC